ncbi:hypothetical protein [Duganella sp. S19_KUP01_CR8]|uniref:hypothetical protein n=1 Tax=Duganella sp. S19_KUP01_CR8 TaxID=3025502 RepID=UPI002FCD94C9
MLLLIIFCLCCLLYLLIAGVRLQANFLDYCRQVADADGRMDEYSRGGSDDSGLTKFEVAIYYDLFKRRSQVCDADLAKLRSYFRQRFVVLMLFSLGFLVSFGILLHEYF